MLVNLVPGDRLLLNLSIEKWLVSNKSLELIAGEL